MAIIHKDIQIQRKLSEKCSIYRIKTLVIHKAIEYIVSGIDLINVSIHSYSLSTLTSLQNHHNTSDITKKIQNAHFTAKSSSKNKSYSWILDHCNIEGIESGDKAAKLTHFFPSAHISSLFSYSDIKHVVWNELIVNRITWLLLSSLLGFSNEICCVSKLRKSALCGSCYDMVKLKTDRFCDPH